MEDDYQMFKIVIIGSSNTGKTNIATRFIRNEYNEGAKNTVGVQFMAKVVQVRNQQIKITLWDTAGQQRYKSLSKVYYKGASGILIVYDITDPQSYLDVQSWMRLANQNLNLNEVVLMVVGNKVDLQDKRKIPSDRAISEYKDKFDIDCWQVSAKNGYNVKEVFNELIGRIYDMNTKLKGSQMPIDIDDESIYQASVAEGSIVNNKNMKKQPITSALPAIIEVDDIQVKKQQIKSPLKQTMKQTIKETVKDKKKENPIKLDTNNKKKKQSSQCSC